jgi:competence protein ComEC
MQSIVLLIEIGVWKLLLCGDADGAIEPIGVDCDVLQVAHHGSKNAAGEFFLLDATPDIALVSVGGNPYGHPDPQTLERIGDVGAKLYRTDESGAITVFFGSESLRVEVYCP